MKTFGDRTFHKALSILGLSGFMVVCSSQNKVFLKGLLFNPMAIKLGVGIVFATSIILVIVPCLYMIMEDGISRLKTA